MGYPYSPDELARYWKLARRMAARWCGADCDAQDVAQEVMLRLFRQTARPHSDVGWIFVVTRRVCNRMRLAAAQRSDAEKSFGVFMRPITVTSELAIEAGSILRGLPARDRRILSLVVSGTPAREIALLIGCKTRDVGQLVSRARQKARRLRDGEKS